jgi:hypothetical protein
MLNDKQSLLLCGILAGGIFITGVLGVLDNFIVLTLLTIVFITIVGNIVATKSFLKKQEESVEKSID